MIELVFVIVVLGILASIAIPKFAATRDDAHIAKARSTIAAVRSGIITERQNRLFRGDNTYATELDDAAANTAGETIFDGDGGSILMYGVTTRINENGHWVKTGATTYAYRLFGANNTFEYNLTTGTFNCTVGANCDDLTD